MDIKTLLIPLKDKDDAKMPSDREELIARFHSQKHRNRKLLSNDEHVLESFREWKEEQLTTKKGNNK